MWLIPATETLTRNTQSSWMLTAYGLQYCSQIFQVLVHTCHRLPPPMRSSPHKPMQAAACALARVPPPTPCTTHYLLCKTTSTFRGLHSIGDNAGFNRNNSMAGTGGLVHYVMVIFFSIIKKARSRILFLHTQLHPRRRASPRVVAGCMDLGLRLPQPLGLPISLQCQNKMAKRDSLSM